MVGLTSSICWACTYLAFNIFNNYTVGLFVWLPLVMGATSTLMMGFRKNDPQHLSFAVPFNTLIIFCIGVSLWGMDGLIYLVMAFPIGVLFDWIGFMLAKYFLEKRSDNSSLKIILLFASVPSLLAFETMLPHDEDLRAVTTTIEINASPEEVWKNVIAFPPLKPPTEFFFNTGIAYPVNATIDGRGAGAIRKCNFSTGSFIEPITDWKEAQLLRFSVVFQPPPLEEISFYRIDPKHLHGTWISRKGQFKLTRLANGHTRLEGTTWYSCNIEPAFYWTAWSDYIVHLIHKRVLQHIKTQSELTK